MWEFGIENKKSVQLIQIEPKFSNVIHQFHEKISKSETRSSIAIKEDWINTIALRDGL